GLATAQLAGAHELYRTGEYGKAETIFHKIAEGHYSGKDTFFGRLTDKTKVPTLVAEEARYYEAECLRRQSYYPKAADTYNKMLIDFPNGAFREQAVQHMFEIANFWLEDTRTTMDESKEQREG